MVCGTVFVLFPESLGNQSGFSNSDIFIQYEQEYHIQAFSQSSLRPVFLTRTHKPPTDNPLMTLCKWTPSVCVKGGICCVCG